MNKLIPSIKVPIIQKGVVSKVILSDELKGKNIIMFGVPGAFTPTCSEKHMPSPIDPEIDFLKNTQERADKIPDDCFKHETSTMDDG